MVGVAKPFQRQIGGGVCNVRERQEVTKLRKKEGRGGGD